MYMEYDNIVTETISHLQESIEKAKKLDQDVKHLRTVIGNSKYFYISFNEIVINDTFRSMDEVKKLLGKLAQAGIMLEKCLESDTNPKWVLKGKYGAIIFLYPYWRTAEELGEDSGVSCRLVQVGTDVREIPRYKLQCD
jgi:hypothetical protein